MNNAVMPQIPLLQVGDKSIEGIRRMQAVILRSLQGSIMRYQLLQFLGGTCPCCRLTLILVRVVGMQAGL